MSPQSTEELQAAALLCYGKPGEDLNQLSFPLMFSLEGILFSLTALGSSGIPQ